MHDVCSAVHPMAAARRVSSDFPLREHGLEWIQPDAPLAHPMDDGTAVMLERSIDATAADLGPDGEAMEAVFCAARGGVAGAAGRRPGAAVARAAASAADGAVRIAGAASGASLARGVFGGSRARALFTGIAAHSVMPLEEPASAAIGIVLATLGHAAGWPVARGGSQRISDALAGYLGSLGGEIRTDSRVEVAARGRSGDVRRVASGSYWRWRGPWPEGFRAVSRRFRYGPGVFKVDWALDGPIPWKAAECARAATVHLGGTMEEIAHGRSNTGAARWCCWRSRACSTRRARRPANTRLGLTVMCRMGRRRT